MEKQLIIKHKHRYTKEEAMLFQGQATYTLGDDVVQYEYKDSEGILTILKLYNSHACIIRKGELHSNLVFKQDETTINTLSSEYGDFEIELFTFEYKTSENYTRIEYDVLSSEEKDGYCIEIESRGKVDELN